MQSPYYSVLLRALYAKCPDYSVLYMQSVLIIQKLAYKAIIWGFICNYNRAQARTGLSITTRGEVWWEVSGARVLAQRSSSSYAHYVEHSMRGDAGDGQGWIIFVQKYFLRT